MKCTISQKLIVVNFSYLIKRIKVWWFGIDVDLFGAQMWDQLRLQMTLFDIPDGKQGWWAYYGRTASFLIIFLSAY